MNKEVKKKDINNKKKEERKIIKKEKKIGLTIPKIKETIDDKKDFLRTPNLSNLETFYQILIYENKSLHFRELLRKAVEGRIEIDNYNWAHIMAELYTQINMDSRFYYYGKGIWGLAEWIAQNDMKVLRQFEASQHLFERKRREMVFETIQEKIEENIKPSIYIDPESEEEVV